MVWQPVVQPFPYSSVSSPHVYVAIVLHVKSAGKWRAILERRIDQGFDLAPTTQTFCVAPKSACSAYARVWNSPTLHNHWGVSVRLIQIKVFDMQPRYLTPSHMAPDQVPRLLAVLRRKDFRRCVRIFGQGLTSPVRRPTYRAFISQILPTAGPGSLQGER